MFHLALVDAGITFFGLAQHLHLSEVFDAIRCRCGVADQDHECDLPDARLSGLVIENTCRLQFLWSWAAVAHCLHHFSWVTDDCACLLHGHGVLQRSSGRGAWTITSIFFFFFFFVFKGITYTITLLPL